MKSLGALVFVMTKWIALRQWAERRGDVITARRAQTWIDDCKARARRINQLATCNQQPATTQVS